MRIVGGESRGRKLKSLHGRAVRPTAERTREALFNMLGPRVRGSRFLDLFAGVGAVGIEALSRGAQEVVLVESSERAARVIQENLSALGAGGRGRLVRGHAVTAVRSLATAGAKFDIIFMDPPYRDRRTLERTLGELARDDGLLAPDALIVVEHDAHGEPLPPIANLQIERTRRFGEATLTFMRPPARPGSDSMALAVYPGTFDPVTNGHLDIIERAAGLFDEVVVGVAVNPAKSPLFTADERVTMLRAVCAHLANVRIEPFAGLLVDFAVRQRAAVVVKGLRAVTDFEYELQQALMNRSLGDGVETVFFAASPQHLFLSSSAVKEIARLGGDISAFVPAQVRARLAEKFIADQEAA